MGRDDARTKESHQPGQVVDRYACDQESCFTAETIVRVPPKIAVCGHVGVMFVERLEAVETANAGTSGMTSQDANGGKN